MTDKFKSNSDPHNNLKTFLTLINVLTSAPPYVFTYAVGD